MKKMKFNIIYLFLTLLLGGMWGACEDNNGKIGGGESVLSVDFSTVSMNKKGLGDNGDTLQVVVTSNTFWQARVPEGAEEWLSLSAMTGEPGNTTVSLIALSPNGETEPRLAEVKFEAFNRNASVVVTVEQRGAKDDVITYLQEGFGGAVTPEFPLNDFVSTASGFVSSGIRYEGTEAWISSINPSTGYAGASGGGHVRLSGTSAEMILALPTANDKTFALEFGVGVAGGIDADPLILEISRDKKLWTPLTYAPAAQTALAAADWQLMKALVTMTVRIDTVWLRFKPAVESDCYIDDIVVKEGDGSGVVEFPKSDMKGLPQSWDMTRGEANFPDWVSKQQIVSDDGKAMFQFVKLPENVHANNTYRYTSDKSTPVIVGLYLNDYYLFTIPVTDFAANTELKVSASGFTSNTGMTYFLIEWSADGEHWTAVNTKKVNVTVDGATREVIYTYKQINSKATPLFDEATGTFIVTQEITDGNLYIRFRVCDRITRAGLNATIAGKGTAVLSAMKVEVAPQPEE